MLRGLVVVVLALLAGGCAMLPQAEDADVTALKAWPSFAGVALAVGALWLAWTTLVEAYRRRATGLPHGRHVTMAVTTIVATVLVTYGAFAVVEDHRPLPAVISPEHLADVDVSDFDALSEHEWREVWAASPADGPSYVRTWQSEGSDLLEIEVWERGELFPAEWVFFSSSTRPRYERRFGDLVRSVNPPATAAERVDMFCGNAGHSATDELDDCQIWGYWARYGHYVIYLEVYGLRMSANDFRSTVTTFDRHIAAVIAIT